MLKTGKYRALRNIPAGWALQAIHSTVRTERFFRIVLEVVILIVTGLVLWATDYLTIPSSLITLVVTHTIFWFITGNFWVYMLDSFLWIENPGIKTILSFVEFTKKQLTRTNSVEAILIYGSMCRGQFHQRSDLDLRVVRRRDAMTGLIALPIGLLMRAYSFFLVLPVDLQVVDGAEFLEKQMREDERPIVVFRRDDFHSVQFGISFEEVLKDPRIIMRSR